MLSMESLSLVGETSFRIVPTCKVMRLIDPLSWDLTLL